MLDEDLPLAVDVLGDMLTSSLVTAEDVEAEREVILDEIAMHDDDPDDVVHNLFAETGLVRHAAGPADRGHARRRSGRSTAAQINRYYRARYIARDMPWRSPATSTTRTSYAW